MTTSDNVNSFETKKVLEHWTRKPIGRLLSNKEYGTREFFEEYDDVREKVIKEHSLPEPLLRRSYFQTDKAKVLDIGCGNGYSIAALSERAAFALGLDISPTALQASRRRRKYWNYDYELIRGDARYLPIADSRFDFVFSSGVLHHSPDIRKSIAEIRRVSRRGSRIVLMLYHRRSALVFAFRLLRFLKLARMTFAEFSDGAGNVRSDTFTTNEVSDMLQKAGFGSVDFSLEFQPIILDLFILRYAAEHSQNRFRFLLKVLACALSKVRKGSLLAPRFFGFYMYVFARP